MDGFWAEIGSVSLCGAVTVECLGKDTITPIKSVEIGSFKLCQQETPEEVEAEQWEMQSHT